MTIATQMVQLNASTPTLVSIPSALEAPYEHNASISIQNIDSSITVYIGGPSVTSSNYGFALTAGNAFAADFQASDQVYAISASGTPTVAIFATEV